MKEIESLIAKTNRVKQQIHDLKTQIYSLKEDDATAKFYLNNLKRLSLQALDLFIALEKQISFLQNQKKILLTKNRQRR